MAYEFRLVRAHVVMLSMKTQFTQVKNSLVKETKHAPPNHLCRGNHRRVLQVDHYRFDHSVERGHISNPRANIHPFQSRRCSGWLCAPPDVRVVDPCHS